VIVFSASMREGWLNACGDPVYSRDGAHIYYSLSSYSGGGQLWVANPTLTSASQLSFSTSND
jgi:Tol biopolymer transport system component